MRRLVLIRWASDKTEHPPPRFAKCLGKMKMPFVFKDSKGGGGPLLFSETYQRKLHVWVCGALFLWWIQQKKMNIAKICMSFTQEPAVFSSFGFWEIKMNVLQFKNYDNHIYLRPTWKKKFVWFRNSLNKWVNAQGYGFKALSISYVVAIIYEGCIYLLSTLEMDLCIYNLINFIIFSFRNIGFKNVRNENMTIFLYVFFVQIQYK